MGDRLQAFINEWHERGNSTVLVLALRRMPEGTILAKVEVPPDLWDFSANDKVGPAILAELKAAEDNRVRNL